MTTATLPFQSSTIHLIASPKWVRVVFAGQTIADTKRAVLLRSQGKRRGTPVYYFPKADVRTDLLRPNGVETTDAQLGPATRYDIAVGDRVAADAAFTYATPQSFEGEAGPDLQDYVAFVWNKMDAWFEENEEVFQHARDPYKRIDCLPSSRHVRVVIGGETVADTHRPILLFETGLLTRYYIPKLDVRMDLLRPSDTVTRCPYKGLAHYYSVEANGQTYKDIVWYYPHATPESTPIAGGYLAFYDEKVDLVEVDGVVNPKPVTPFS
jgi:uncharacterized protein (DUF427 family)